MNRNLTPRPVRATGAKDAHGSILDADSGALYVHMHRESGLAHRHYVLKPWQVRALAVLISRPMLIVYVVALVTWGWMATQALRVPLLQQRVGELTRDAARLDTLTVRLSELQDRYDQVQRMLGSAARVQGRTDSARTKAPPAPPVAPPATTPAAPDTARKPASPVIP
jgi:hypothetical protein